MSQVYNYLSFSGVEGCENELFPLEGVTRDDADKTIARYARVLAHRIERGKNVTDVMQKLSVATWVRGLLWPYHKDKPRR